MPAITVPEMCAFVYAGRDSYGYCNAVYRSGDVMQAVHATRVGKPSECRAKFANMCCATNMQVDTNYVSARDSRSSPLI